MSTRIQLRRDTAANWTSNNPTLSAGELGIETDTNKFKIGSGTTAWNSLSYASTSNEGPTTFASVQTYNTTGILNNVVINDKTTIFRYTGNLSSDLTGLSGGTDGRIILIENATSSESWALNIIFESSNSSASNRFAMSYPLDVDDETTTVTMRKNDAIMFVYSGSQNRWVMVRPSRVFYSNLADTTLTAPAGSLTGDTIAANVTASSLVSFGTNPNIGAATGTSLNVSGTISATALGSSLLSSVTPNSISGTATVGTAVIPSRQDHQHGTFGLVTTNIVTTKGDLLVATGSAAITKLTAGTDSYVLTADSSQTTGLKWAKTSKTQSISFTQSGYLYTTTGTYRWYNDSGSTLNIDSVRASVGVPPTGDSIIVDVNVNGSSIYSSSANQPTIVADAYTDVDGTKATSTITNGQYFTIDVDQVGSNDSGSDLTVTIWLSAI